MNKTATITEITGPGTLNKNIVGVKAKADDGTPISLCYPRDDPPEVGREIEVFFEMGGWNTHDSSVYKNRQGYDQ